MKSQCYFQKLIGGNVEAIVQLSDGGKDSRMKVLLTKTFPNTPEAQRWWKTNRDNIKIVAGRIPK